MLTQWPGVGEGDDGWTTVCTIPGEAHIKSMHIFKIRLVGRVKYSIADLVLVCAKIQFKFKGFSRIIIITV